MPRIFPAIRLACLALAFAAMGTMAAEAAPVDHTGRGIFHFASASGCPFASANATGCNRIALDVPDVHASVDTATHTIVFSGGAGHLDDEVLGDVLLQGNALDEQGQRVPLSLQVLLRRSGLAWNRDPYVHTPVRGNLTDIHIDPYRIDVREGDATRTLMTPEDAHVLLEHPSLAARLASHFVQVYATDPQHPSGDDITIALGLGSLSKAVVRVSFTSGAPRNADINPVLTSGTWAIQFNVLSSHIPVWVVRRELFLFGLDHSPLTQAMSAQGFQADDQIEMGARNGKGYLRVNGREEPFTGAATSGYAFLQESFMGLILAWYHNPANAALLHAALDYGKLA